MDCIEIELENVELIHRALKTAQWRTAVKLRIPKNAGNFLAS
jgi:hypothetical protein